MSRHDRGSPTVRRRRLGLQLKGHRGRARMTPEAVAGALQTTSRTVLRWEAGAANIRPRDLGTLLDLYAVPEADRPDLFTLAREARLQGWWSPYTSSVRPTFATFLGLEDEAASLCEYSAMLIPGLLQTEPYMRAVMNADVPLLPDETIEQRIALRIKRQAGMLEHDRPSHFIIDQACLLRRVGSVEIMNDQLAHLIEVAKSRLVTIQVLSFEIGAHASIMGGFSVLTFEEMPPVACVELVAGDLYADGDDSERYTLHFNALRQGALPEPLALALVERIRKDVHHAL